MAISTKEELQFLLHRGWEIEKKFESLSVWKAFVAVGSAYRKTILTLGRDSQKHRLALEKLLKTLNIESPTNKMVEGNFDFSDKHDSETLQEIAKQDEIAKDLYSEIAEKTDPKLIVTLSGEKAVDLFYRTLKQLVNDEEKHVKMVKDLAGHLKRIL